MTTPHLTPDELAALALELADPAEAAPWHAHLAECADCRAALAADGDLLGRMAGAEPPEVEPRRWEALLRGALDEVRPLPAAEPAARPARGTLALLGAWGWRAATLLVVFLIGYHAGTSRGPGRLGAQTWDARITSEAPFTTATLRQPLERDTPVTSDSVRFQRMMVKADDLPRRI